MKINFIKKIILNRKPLPKANHSNIIPTKILYYISLVKIIAVFSVVILHTNYVFWIFRPSNYKNYWISANIVECIFYFAVPSFVLCIGATLLNFNEKYGLKTYFLRRINKVIIPLILWSIILYYYKVYIIKKMKQIQFKFIAIWNLFFQNKIYFIFGSLHTFIISYMIIPLIAYIDKTEKLKIYTYCFLALFITQSLIPYLISVFEPNLAYIYKIQIGFTIYLFAGYIIQNYKFNKISRIIIFLLGILSLLIHIIGTQILTIRYRKIIKTHKGYVNVPCIIYSSALFLFIKEYSYILFKLFDKNKVSVIGSLTIGPFFMHLPFIDTCNKYIKMNHYSLSYRVNWGIIVCLICLILSFILKKIPIVKFLVP